MRKVVLALVIGIVFVIFAVRVLSAEDRVFVFNIHYDEGDAELTDFVVKYGFAPDRNVDEGDSLFEVLNSYGDVLESFSFDIPLKEFTDFTDMEGKVSGGVIVYSEKDFSIVAPYHSSATKIRITKGSEVLLYEDIREKHGPRIHDPRIRGIIGALSGVFIGLIAGIGAIYLIKKRSRGR